MGIFSNRCEALVNPVTGKALYGAALEEARQKPNWPRCGHSVKKAANVCSKCGAPAPGGWWRCPTCGEWVGNDSRFCPYCNAPLYPDERAAVAGGVWHKTPELFAQRFEVADISRLSDSGLQVQAGTVAVLLDAGAVKDVLDAGRYNLESLARKINWFNNPPPRSVVLLDAGEVVLPISFDGVLTKSKEFAKVYVEVVVRFVGGQEAAANFISNVLKGERSLSFANLVDRLEPLFRLAVADMCAESTLEELAGDLWRRARLRDTALRLLEDDLQSTGLAVVRISSCEFTNPEYEARVRDMVEREKQRRLEELEQRKDLEAREKEQQRVELEQQRAMEDFDRRKRQAEFEAAREAFEQELMLGKFKSEQELCRAKAALEDEYNISELERHDNWKRLMEKRADENATRQRAREKAERAYREQEEEEARQKATIQLAREEKAREEAAIRRMAALDRQWAVTDKLSRHARAEEVRRFNEAEERRTRRWEAVKDEAQRLWEKKKEEWRQEDERCARERENEIKGLQHEIGVDGIRTDADIAKRIKISDALHEELIRKAKAESELKKIVVTRDAEVKTIAAQGIVDEKIIAAKGAAEVKTIEAANAADVQVIAAMGASDARVTTAKGAAEANVIAAKGAAEVNVITAKGAAEANVIAAKSAAEASHIGHVEKVGQTKDWNNLSSEEDMRLRKELADLQARADKLRAEVGSAANDRMVKMVQDEYDRILKRMDAINKELES